MNVGFTGTRQGMTNEQKFELARLLGRYSQDMFEPWFLHGNCIGADEEAAIIANNLQFKLWSFPCDIPDLQSKLVSHRVELIETPLTRDRHIVRECDILIATPKENARPSSYRGSGTWYTINHCLKQNVKRRHVIIWPDGRLEHT